MARWSPNGRFLAVIKSIGSQFPMWEDYDLSVLDTATGKLYPIDAAKLIGPYMANQGGHAVSDIAWGPENRHLLAIGTLFCAGSSCWQPGSFRHLVDFLSGEVNPLVLSDQVYGGFPGTSLAWSPDGSTVLAICRDGLCLLSVQRTGH